MIRVRVWEHGGDAVSCELTIPLRNNSGSIKILATMTQRQVLEALRNAGVTFQHLEQVGSLFGSIGKALKKVAKSSVLKKALSLGKALVNNPLVKIVAPEAALAIAAAHGAAKIVSAARSKDPKQAAKAKVALVAAKAQAKEENKVGKPLPLPSGVANRSPETKAAYRYLVTVNRAAA